MAEDVDGRFFDATSGLIDTLDQVNQALAEQRLPDAQALLEQAAPAVVRYLAEVDGVIATTDAQIAELKKRATKLSDEIASDKAELDDLEGKLAAADAKIADLDTRKADLALKNATLSPLVTTLESSIQARKEKLDELKKWFWVPGYGQYLAIRTLVDEDITKLQSSQQELRDNARMLTRNENALSAVRKTLQGLSDQVADMQSRLSDLRRLADRANLELARAKSRTAFLIDARSFMADLRAMASNFETFSLPHLSTVLSRLANRGLDSRMSVLNRQANTFAGDLREFAMAVDAHENFLTYAPASGNFVEIANHGAYVMKARAVGSNRSEHETRQSPWSKNLALGRRERIDVRRLELADNALFWIEVALVLGPTLRSADIRYIEQPAPEIARFTASGTVFAATLDHQP